MDKILQEKERFEQWQKLSSHYSIEGVGYYSEWEQLGNKIRNHILFKRVYSLLEL